MKHICYYILILVLLHACAKVISPSGGKKDTEAPKIINAIPANFSTNFNSSLITLRTDEFIKLKDPNNHIFISPMLKNKIDIKLKNKKITLKLNNTLEPNTTYIINFNETIADITEGNTIQNYKYVFSTGNFIDSLSIKGKITSVPKNITEKDILVMLYKEINDSIVFKEMPDYFTKTDKNGIFNITNIKNNNYKLFSLKDINNNFIYDLPNEMVAFIDTPIIVTDTSSFLQLNLFQEDNIKLKLIRSFSTSYNKVVFIFNKPTKNISINTYNTTAYSNSSTLKEYSKNRDTITYWTPNLHSDSLQFIVSEDNNIIDSTTVKMSSFVKKSDLIKKLNISSPTKNDALINPGKPLLLIFSQPIKTSILKNIHLLEDSSEVSVKPEYTFIDDVSRKFAINYKWKTDTRYKLIIPDSCFTDIFNLINNKFSLPFKTKNYKAYGNLKLTLTLENPDKNFILQLLNNNNIINETILSTTTDINYNNLDPKEYKLKIIYDKNKNGKWDTGNYLHKIQAEKVYYYPKNIKVRSNWDIELEISESDLAF